MACKIIGRENFEAGMRKKIKRILCFLLALVGITQFIFYLCFRRRNKILVLLYHRISKPEDPFEPAVSPVRFDKQMQFLQNYFNVVSVQEALSHMAERQEAERQEAEKPLAVITFDDGYRDNLENAYPILKKYSLPAVFFLATGSIGDGEPMWTSRMEIIFKNARVSELTLESLDPRRSFELGDGYERMKVCYEIKSAMKKVPDERRQMILKEIEEKIGLVVDPFESDPSEMLSWEEVKQLASDPLVEIGSHSVSHRMLTQIPTEEVQWELEESKSKIESEIGRKVDYLSYPGNSYNDFVREAAEQAGYRAAFAVDRTLTRFNEDRFALKRVHVENEPFETFLAEISLILPFFRSWFGFRKRKAGES